jgi:anti-sigma B factor antagonist
LPIPPRAAVRHRVVSASREPSLGIVEPFRCKVSRADATARVRVLGDLDMAGAPVLEAEITALCTAGTRSIVLDLTGLRFIDSTGLRCILECVATSERHGFSIALIPGPHAVHRVFELTNTHAFLPFVAP